MKPPIVVNAAGRDAAVGVTMEPTMDLRYALKAPNLAGSPRKLQQRFIRSDGGSVWVDVPEIIAPGAFRNG